MTGRDPVAHLLRYLRDHGNDAAPTAFLGHGAEQDVHQRAMPFVRAVEQLGLIEPTMPPGFGPEGDLARVRVTPLGDAYLAEHPWP